ncbi:hypothetical protein FDP41_006721 [Naegleria fowleri]|uniref:DH domain-containing protein n=1 Tax=Naegleria fowleri TaxID=5763 RepID=A0A6A5BI36_NAEFO|nr:uncharacterized protein FDP41_006721 [Naegleria fowleri]KAF0974111.1 hypothetical protein FDP41_006721 [Naegleria fowleri]
MSQQLDDDHSHTINNTTTSNNNNNSTTNTTTTNSTTSTSMINDLKQLLNLLHVIFIIPILQFIQHPQLGSYWKILNNDDDDDGSNDDDGSSTASTLNSSTTTSKHSPLISIAKSHLSSSLGGVSTHTPRGSKRMMVGEENQQNKAQIIRERIMNLSISTQQGSLLHDDDEDHDMMDEENEDYEQDDDDDDMEDIQVSDHEEEDSKEDSSSSSSLSDGASTTTTTTTTAAAGAAEKNNSSTINTSTPSTTSILTITSSSSYSTADPSASSSSINTTDATSTPTTLKVPKLSLLGSSSPSSSSSSPIHVRSRSSGLTISSSTTTTTTANTTTTRVGGDGGGGGDTSSMVPTLQIGSLPVTSNYLSNLTAPSTLSARGKSASNNRNCIIINGGHGHGSGLESSPHMRLVNNEIERILQTPNACDLKLNSLTLTIFPHKLFNLFKTHKITKIDVSDNRLTSLSYHFTNSFPYLEELNLSRNLFTSMFNDFNKLKYLRVLDLSYNGFEILPQNVLQCTNLQELYLNHNSLIALQPDIAKLQQLQVLDISNNLLSKLPDELTQLKNLKKLNVSNNKYIDSAMKIIMDLYKQNPNLERDIKSEDLGDNRDVLLVASSSPSSLTTAPTTTTNTTTTASATTHTSSTTTTTTSTTTTTTATPTKTDRSASMTNLSKTPPPPPHTISPPNKIMTKVATTTTTTTSTDSSLLKTSSSMDTSDALTTKRVYSILELIESEFKYKNYLETLFNEFMLPISNCDDLQQQGQLKFIGCGIQDGPQFVKKIFPPDLENILKCSQMFYRELVKILLEPTITTTTTEATSTTQTRSQKKRKNSELHRTLFLLKNQIYDYPVGQIFQRFIPFFKVYIDYQCHYSRTVHQNLPQAYSQYPKFKQVIEMAKTVTGTDGLDISSLLIMPCQRIVKYCLLLKAIMKETPTDHPDYPLLEIASTKMQATAHEINRKMKDIANLRNLIDIASQYSIDGLVVSTRRFISTTSVKIYIVPSSGTNSSSSNSGTSGSNTNSLILQNTSGTNIVTREKAKIHLFNDRILFTTIEDSHYYFSVGSLLQLGRNPSELYKLSEVELPSMDNTTMDKTKVSLNILPKSSQYILECESESVCNTLTQQLKDLLTTTTTTTAVQK